MIEGYTEYRPTYVGFCEAHGKELHASRKTARRAIGRRKGMRAYPCDYVPGGFHVGHLPAVIRRGKKTADQVYRGSA